MYDCMIAFIFNKLLFVINILYLFKVHLVEIRYGSKLTKGQSVFLYILIYRSTS